MSKKERSHAAPLFHIKEDERDFLFGWKRPEIMVGMGDISLILSLSSILMSTNQSIQHIRGDSPYMQGNVTSKHISIFQSSQEMLFTTHKETQCTAVN
jgi:hypothetical protein